MIDIFKTPIKKVPNSMGDEAFQEAINRGAERDGKANPHEKSEPDEKHEGKSGLK